MTTDDNTALYFADGRAFGATHAAPSLTDAPEVGRVTRETPDALRLDDLLGLAARVKVDLEVWGIDAHQLADGCEMAVVALRNLAGDLETERADSAVLKRTADSAIAAGSKLLQQIDAERAAHRLTVLELTAAREEAGITLQSAQAEIADLKARLLGMTAVASDATTAALAASDLLVAWRKADRHDASEASFESRDALEHATSNLRGAAGKLLAEREVQAHIEPLAEASDDDTIVVDVPDIDPATTSIMDWIVEAVSIDRARATYSPLVALADLISEWLEATNAYEAFRGGANAGKSSPAGDAALERLDTVERMLAMAGAR